ncbi:MAG: GNAT family N-acetyltransferase [Flavobacteriales bacterium]|nr:GNAT family N-acetyltransferase [Flavobacteriales bacterium]
MEVVKTRMLTEGQQDQINDLWNSEYPAQLKDRFKILLEGVENYLHYLILDPKGIVLAWAAYFEKENEIRFSLVVAKNAQGKGLGTLLLNFLKNDLEDYSGWVVHHNNYLKLSGEPYRSPLNFYLKNGFEVEHNSESKSDLLHAVKVRPLSKK